MNAKIYKIINDINDKIYVGQTFKSIENRFSRHCAEARWRNIKKMPIVLAIAKYGKEHFQIFLLEELPDNLTQTEVDKKEIDWGLKLNTLSPFGYNLKLGNAAGVMSEETKQKIANSNKGRKASPETIKRLKESHTGHKPKESTLAKLSAYYKGKKPHENTRLGAIRHHTKHYKLRSPEGEIVEIYGMKVFAEKMGFQRSNLSGLATGQRKSYNGWTLA